MQKLWFRLIGQIISALYLSDKIIPESSIPVEFASIENVLFFQLSKGEIYTK